MAKKFDTVWVDGLLHKLTFLKFLSYLWKSSSPICIVGSSQVPLNIHIYLSLRAGWRGSGWNNLSRPIQSICQRHAYAFPLLYTDDTAIIATSRQPALLIYLETYLSDLGRWLGEWRIACVSKSTVMLFAMTSKRIPKLQTVQLFGQQIHWVETARYLGVTLDTRLTLSIHIDQVRKKQHRLGVLAPLLNRRNDPSIRNWVMLYKQLIRTMIDYACPIWRFAAHTHVTKLLVFQSKCLRIATSAPWFTVTYKFTRISEFHPLPTTSDFKPRDSTLN